MNKFIFGLIAISIFGFAGVAYADSYVFHPETNLWSYEYGAVSTNYTIQTAGIKPVTISGWNYVPFATSYQSFGSSSFNYVPFATTYVSFYQ